MKKSITVVIILFSAFLSLKVQGQENLRYQLKEGDEFTYHIQAQSPEDPAPYLQNWLKFKVLKKRTGGYELSVVFSRISVNSSQGNFDSKNYYASDLKDQRAENNPFLSHQLALEMPIYFTLSNQGEISDIHYSIRLEHAIAQRFKGIVNKYNFNKSSFLSIPNLHQKLQLIFLEYPENAKASTWSNQMKQHQRFPITELNYTKTDSAGHHSIALNGDYQNEDSVSLKIDYMRKSIPLDLKTEGRYITAKETGLPETGVQHTSAHYDFLVEFGEVSNRATVEKNDVTTIRKVSSEFSDQVTTVFGQVDPADVIDVNLFVWHEFPDRDLVSEATKIDKDGRFNFSFELSRTTEVAFSIQYPGIKSRNYKILLSPGDRIELNVDEKGRLTYSGEDAQKSIILRKTRLVGEFINQDATATEALATVERNLNKKFSVLETEKPQLESWAYELIKADIYFREQSKLLDYYYDKNEGKVNEAMFNELFKNLNLTAYTSTKSFEFRRFARGYVIRKLLILHGYTDNRIISVKERFALSKMLFNGEQRYYTMAAIAHEEINEGNFSLINNLTNEFNLEYPNSELARHLEKLRRTKSDMSEGSIAPDFTLSTLDGERVSLSDYKGKWVILSFADLDYESTYEEIKYLNQINERIPKKDIVFLLAFTQESTDSTKAFLEENPLDVITLDNHGWKEPGTIAYDVEIIEPFYLISPEGIIEHRGDVEPWDLFIEMFVEYIQDDLKLRASQKSKSTPLPLWVTFIIIASVLAVICTWLLFRLKAARLERKQQVKLEKVEMEIRAVRSQLNPHFLFNAMSSIQHLVNTRQVEKANHSIAKFAGLMRKVLNQAESQMLSLAQELETLRDYLDLEALRHGFTFHINIQDKVDIYNTDIPPMLLQPFVENAVIHGISHIKEAGKIEIEIGPSGDDAIFIRILDNGRGLNGQPSPASNGKGLELTRRRIHLFMEKFKNEISFAIKDRQGFDGQRGAFAEIIVGLEK